MPGDPHVLTTALGVFLDGFLDQRERIFEVLLLVLWLVFQTLLALFAGGLVRENARKGPKNRPKRSNRLASQARGQQQRRKGCHTTTAKPMDVRVRENNLRMGLGLKPRLGMKLGLLVFAIVWTQNIWAQQDQRAIPAANSTSQDQGPSGTPDDTNPDRSKAAGCFKQVLVDFGQDQRQVWTSPARIGFSDTAWLVPFGGIAAGLFVTDRQYSASLSNTPSTIRRYKNISNAGIAGLAGAAAGMYLMSFPVHDEHWRETGWLASEAALNSLIPIEVMKYSLRRERPYQGAGGGHFFQGGTSFPSEHAAAAWSIASVIAHEYPGVLPQLISYGSAAAIDFSRIHGRQHFPSDVLVGSVLGYLVAQDVYGRRHKPEIGGKAWEPLNHFMEGDRSRSPAYLGSPYVPLDSWIYPAIERLAAFGFIRTASLGLRPWTRLECARLVREADDLQVGDSDFPEVQQLYTTLSDEFVPEFGLIGGDRNMRAQLESVYARSVGIYGTPLTDNFHFGQTIVNDYGRPFQEGFNSIAGLSGWAAAGPFVFYTRGEYESAPSAPSLSRSTMDFISSVDGLPPNAPASPIPAISRFRFLDIYVAMNLANWQLSYGKQSQWWGASSEGPMLFTDNIEPLANMFRVDRVAPFRLPWIFRYLGDIRGQFFIGQQSGAVFLTRIFSGTTGPPFGQYGQTLHPQPYITGEKISFKFTQNFEFNLGKTTVYGGPGNPLTFKTFYEATTGRHVHRDVLGDGRSGVDFSYRIPKMRDWLTFYGDAFNEDEISPLAYPRKAAFEGGLYFTKLPSLSKVDLRLEGGSTSPPNYPPCNGCFYSNLQYVTGYRNDSQLIGSWLGRAAQGESVQSNYWFSPKKKVGLELRHRKVDRQFLPQGGTQNDVAANAEFTLRAGIRLSGSVQYEQWAIPQLAASRQSNISVSFQFGYWPTRQFK